MDFMTAIEVEKLQQDFSSFEPMPYVVPISHSFVYTAITHQFQFYESEKFDDYDEYVKASKVFVSWMSKFSTHSS